MNIPVWYEAYEISEQDKNIDACCSTVINGTVLLIVFFFCIFVLLDVLWLCMLVCSILVLCMICAAEMANKDTHSKSQPTDDKLSLKGAW